MKRKSMIVLCAILAGIFLFGCGGEYAGKTDGRKAVSEGAVSGQVVSGQIGRASCRERV